MCYHLQMISALRFIPCTEMDIAVANAAVALSVDSGGQCRDARVAIGAVGPRAVLVPDAAAAVEGRSLDDATTAALAAAVRAAARPIDDKRGTAEYRIHVVGVLAVRAARLAFERAEASR